MKPFLPAALFTLFSLCCHAQQNYFVYLQTDNKQPFYVKMDNKMMSSSSSGYIVIPKLANGSRSFVVGFPKDEWPQQNLSIKVDNADAGYLLKNFGERGWGLYNLQTTEVTMAGAASVPVKTNVEEDDAFARALSEATNTPVHVTEKPSVFVEPVMKRNETPVMPQKKAFIETIANTVDASGRSIVYIDKSGWATDTIGIFIPAPGPVVNIRVDSLPPTKEESTSLKDTRFLDINMATDQPAASAIDKATVADTARPVRNALTFNSDCKLNASDEDFLKVRKKMAATTDEDAMVNAARKFFKSKCYSTEQIRNLSLLFLNDIGKYKFFDAAYSRVYDTQNFAALERELKDQYYINRFKSMIHN